MDKVKDISFSLDFANKIGTKESVIYKYISFKLLEGRFFLDIDDISKDISIISKNCINNSINNLIEKGYIKKNILSSIEKENILSSKEMEHLGVGNKTCEWCGCKTTILNKHHHPIPKKDKGIKLVNICPNCHCEFHHLVCELEVVDRG